MRSMSLPSSPAHASARLDAMIAISMPLMWLTRRSFMPVRDVIHSSLVSRKVERSALVSTEGGMAAPQPVMAAYVMAAL